MLPILIVCTLAVVIVVYVRSKDEAQAPAK
jgi:hypothetical protein